MPVNLPVSVCSRWLEISKRRKMKQTVFAAVPSGTHIAAFVIPISGITRNKAD